MSKRKKKPRRRLGVRTAIVSVCLMLLSAGGLAAYKRNYDITHDLSVLGNGTPTVVQVHDSGCALCRQLKDNVKEAGRDFDGRIQFRIADIYTSEGRSIAREHNVGHVTLLLFDGDGERRRVLQGVIDAETLRHVFKRLAQP